MRKFLVARVSGHTEVLTNPDTAQLQKAVGGYFLPIYDTNSPDAEFALLCNEEKLEKGGALNLLGTSLMGFAVFGDVVVISPCKDEYGRILPAWGAGHEPRVSIEQMVKIVESLHSPLE